METALYTIENFSSERGQGRNYGPSIILAARAVKAIVQLPEKRDESAPLLGMLGSRLRNSITGLDRSLARVDFYKDTWLLTSIVVGDECECCYVSHQQCLGIDRENFVNLRYSAHNIGSLEKSAVVLSVWLLWFNLVIDQTEFKLPISL